MWPWGGFLKALDDPLEFGVVYWIRFILSLGADHAI